MKAPPVPLVAFVFSVISAAIVMCFCRIVRGRSLVFLVCHDEGIAAAVGHVIGAADLCFADVFRVQHLYSIEGDGLQTLLCLCRPLQLERVFVRDCRFQRC